MENQINAEGQNTQQIDQDPVKQSVQIPEKPRVSYWMISTIVLVFLLLGMVGIYVLNQKTIDNNVSLTTSNQLSKTPLYNESSGGSQDAEQGVNQSAPYVSPTQIVGKKQLESSPTIIPSYSPSKVVPTKTQANGASLMDIKYVLPQGWEGKLNNDSLFISPVNSGGFLSIRVYDYPSNIGRREYYCQVSKVCIDGTSYFTEMNIGNISGYEANALDNSGGGAEYFGAKGNKFYITSSYNPPSPNEFEKNYRNVLNSLVF